MSAVDLENKIKIDIDVRHTYSIKEIVALYKLAKTGKFVFSDDMTIVVDIDGKSMDQHDMERLVPLLNDKESKFVIIKGSPKYITPSTITYQHHISLVARVID